MSAPPPGLYTIAPGRAFLNDLADGIVQRFGSSSDPLALSRVTIFLPTRRGARTLAAELTRAAGRDALVLPRIATLGDVDEDEGLIDAAADLGDLPPDISRLERMLILAGRIETFRRAQGSPGGFSVALSLAQSLARLIDEAANEDADLTAIHDLAPPELAAHWEASVRFLGLVTRDWPQILEERKRMDPAARRAALIRAYAARLDRQRPVDPFIVAGSSGSIRATADLMKVIAGLPNGAIVLNGLDTELDAMSWDALPASHPQFALKELLDRIGVTRANVGPWQGSAGATEPRTRFLSEAMRPPETTERWTENVDTHRLSAGLDGLSLIEAANEREESLAIAVAMRAALETPGRTVSLVTADRMLARRVAADLKRWDIEADDSAGRPLAKTEAGGLLTLALSASASGGVPLDLLALLKHPAVTLGMTRSDVLHHARLLERRVLRPLRVTGGFADMRAMTVACDDEGRPLAKLGDDVRAGVLRLLMEAEQALAPLTALTAGTHRLARLAQTHRSVIEALTRTDTATLGWRGADGAAAFAVLQDMTDANTTGSADYTLQSYAQVLDLLLRGQAVRPPLPHHPRVAILGQQEARMQHADLMILGGLNEGVWPGNPADDPWLSRPMRAKLGLTEPERRIGLAAHDFVALAAQHEVILTRARRKDGAPSNPSRFLLRLTTLAQQSPQRVIPAHPSLAIARALDQSGIPQPASRPMPRPPVSARPRSLSVTRIETWVRDPYAIYAELVLKLKPLKKLARALDARDRGDMIHKAVELFALRPSWSGDPFDVLLETGRQAFGAALNDPDVRAFWWPRYLRAAAFLADQETRWRETRAHQVIERREVHHYDDVDFTLTGKPDRIDRLKSGGVRVIDYKTGALPSGKQAKAFMAPQLPLLAAMARAGAFGAQMQGPPEELLYVQLGGGRKPGMVMTLKDPVLLTDKLEAQLKEQVRLFDLEDTPYPPRVAVLKMAMKNDYDHLSRFAEWSEGIEAGESDEGDA